MLRSLRTLFAVSIWVSSIYINVLLPPILLYRLIVGGLTDVILWFLLAFIAYLTFVPLESTEGTFSVNFTRFAAAEGARYFPMKVILDDPASLDEGKSYVLGMEPHSSLPIALPAVFATQSTLLPKPLRGNCHGLASSVCFKVPLVRQLWWWLGLRPVSRVWMDRLLQQGKSVVLVPGGVQEVLMLQDKKEVLFLKSRTGFVKVAMRNGAPIIPVFAFGQTATYSWFRPGPPLLPAWAVSQISRVVGAVPIFMYGMYGTPLPHRHPMHVVIGKPISVPHTAAPSDEQASDALKQYIAALEGLYDKYKAQFGQEDVELQIL